VSEQKPEPTTINAISAGVSPAYALLAGMQLGVFTALAQRPMDHQELAGALGGVDARRLRIVLHALTAVGLLTAVDGRFGNTPEADAFLVEGTPRSMAGLHELWAELWHAQALTTASVRTGRAQAEHDYAAMDEAQLLPVIRGLRPNAAAAGRALAARYDFSAHRRLLDVGGGSGGLSVALTAACPGLRATVVDLPQVARIARRLVVEEGAAERVEVREADLLGAPPSGGPYDVAVARAFVQVLDADAAARALANVGSAVRAGGELYIVGNVLEDDRLAPRPAVLFNLVLLNFYDRGEAYTASEHRAWLRDAGFEDVQVDWNTMPAGNSVVRARKR
jgi:SAM-dependent methyltransferase